MTHSMIDVKTENGFCQFTIYAARSTRVRFNGAAWSIIDHRGWHPKVIRGLTAQGVRDFLAAA